MQLSAGMPLTPPILVNLPFNKKHFPGCKPLKAIVRSLNLVILFCFHCVYFFKCFLYLASSLFFHSGHKVSFPNLSERKSVNLKKSIKQVTVQVKIIGVEVMSDICEMPPEEI